MAVRTASGESLVDRAVAGDEAAFASLIAQHNAAMARVAYVIVGDSEATLDAVQSAWTLAWRRMGTLRDQSQVRSWLIAIAANEARLHQRRQRRRNVVDISAALEIDGSSAGQDSAAILDLQRALQDLKPDERHLLALRYVAGFDSSEIAQYLGVSASGVRSRLARLLERLRAELGPENEVAR